MKLKNKKTGEIGEIGYIGSTDGSIDVNPINRVACETIASYNSLAELNEEWEDYEEPKEYYYLNEYLELNHEMWTGTEFDNKLKAIGNYFETEEEAEKAVEKLKAWKRLKDNGLVIKKWSHTPGMHLTTGSFLKIEGFIPAIMKNMKDLDLLFGGEG